MKSKVRACVFLDSADFPPVRLPAPHFAPPPLAGAGAAIATKAPLERVLRLQRRPACAFCSAVVFQPGAGRRAVAVCSGPDQGLAFASAPPDSYLAQRGRAPACSHERFGQPLNPPLPPFSSGAASSAAAAGSPGRLIFLGGQYALLRTAAPRCAYQLIEPVSRSKTPPPQRSGLCRCSGRCHEGTQRREPGPRQCNGWPARSRATRPPGCPPSRAFRAGRAV